MMFPESEPGPQDRLLCLYVLSVALGQQKHGEMAPHPPPASMADTANDSGGCSLRSRTIYKAPSTYKEVEVMIHVFKEFPLTQVKI